MDIIRGTKSKSVSNICITGGAHLSWPSSMMTRMGAGKGKSKGDAGALSFPGSDHELQV